MNVTVENLAPCKKLVRVEVEAEKVDLALETVTKEFQREANLPGFRPGKAPKEMVLRKYGKDIEDEAKRKLLNESYRAAMEEQKFDVMGAPDIEEVQFGRGQAMIFTATVESSPEFELPEYQGIPVKKEQQSVTEEDVHRALDSLRQSQVSYKTVERPAATGDAVVVSYTGTCEGNPITALAPTAKGLTEQKNFWVELGSNSFIPGFGEQLTGAKAGEKRTVHVDFPADFVTPQLAGKKGIYEVEVAEVKEKVLPELDDELAKTYAAENLEKLKEGVRRDLENELTYSQTRNIRNQIVTSLLNRVQFELPETVVAQQTRNYVYNIVQENAQRGIPRQAIEQERDKIYSAAAQSAKERLKLEFLLQRIAEKENIKVAQEEVAARITTLAAMHKTTPEKLAEDLRKRGALIEVFDQILNEKVLDFLQQKAAIEEVPAQKQ